MERDHDGNAHDRHVDGEAQPREKGALVGAVVAGIGGVVGDEERGEEGKRSQVGG